VSSCVLPRRSGELDSAADPPGPLLYCLVNMFLLGELELTPPLTQAANHNSIWVPQ